MKKSILVLMLVMASATTIFAQTKKDSTAKKTAMSATKYSCPMHPKEMSDKPGKCAICKMDMVAVKKKAHKDSTAKKPMMDMKM
ncbi:heavy metal-binding domain-containing protein [Parasediminibacterium paludis]|uniref:Heavy metal-binding domain-containing protein n=1 Tax=Parasediminibacterium paludis TaxID=908966 RepID=A0ABV8PZE6_9BACT